MKKQVVSSQQTYRSGFSLLELLVVISIISILASVALIAYDLSRKTARDAQRIEAVSSLSLFMEQFKLQHGRYPRCTGGVRLEPGLPTPGTCEDSASLADLATENNYTWPTDPIGSGHARYFYFYHSDQTCGGSGIPGETKAILFAQMEVPENSNQAEVCPPETPPTANNDGYLNQTASGETNFPRIIRVGDPVN